MIIICRAAIYDIRHRHSAWQQCLNHSQLLPMQFPTVNQMILFLLHSRECVCVLLMCCCYWYCWCFCHLYVSVSVLHINISSFFLCSFAFDRCKGSISLVQIIKHRKLSQNIYDEYALNRLKFIALLFHTISVISCWSAPVIEVMHLNYSTNIQTYAFSSLFRFARLHFDIRQ